MKNEILKELLSKWKYQGNTEVEDGSESGKLMRSKEEGYRHAKNECAEELESLLKLFPE